MVTLRYGQQIFDIYARRTVHAVFHLIFKEVL